MEEAANKQRDYWSGLIRVRLPKTHLKWFISSYQALLPKVLYYLHLSIATSWDQGLMEDISYLKRVKKYVLE